MSKTIADITVPVNKISGIWMQLDAILHQEKRANVWDHRGEYSKITPKKKEKLKLRSKALLMCHPHHTGPKKYLLHNDEKHGHGLLQSSLLQQCRKRKDKGRKNFDADKYSEIDALETEDYINPLVECSFNLTRVSAQLERLMGTNVVRLTDRKYMMELRQRIHEDFNEMLAKRIENREVKEMERQRNLFMEGKSIQCSEEYSNHPIFIANQTTNQPNVKRRSKLKTNRQKNAERLIRQGAKWEKERQKLNEIERQRELEEKAQQKAALNMVIDLYSTNKDPDRQMPRLRSIADSDLSLKELMDDDSERSICQNGKPKAKERRSKSMLTNQESDETNTNAKSNESATNDIDLRHLQYDEIVGENGEQIISSNRSHLSQTAGKFDADKIQYEDPMVSELKQTESVRDMYKLANEIISGKANTNPIILEQSSSSEDEEVVDVEL